MARRREIFLGGGPDVKDVELSNKEIDSVRILIHQNLPSPPPSPSGFCVWDPPYANNDIL